MSRDWRYPAELDTVTIKGQQVMERGQWRLILAATIGFSLLLSAMAWRSAPSWSPVAFAVLFISCVAAFVRPSAGVYLIVVLTMIGDGVIWPWWPFTKNLSSRESILYLNDAIYVNPLEIVMLTTLVSFLLRRLADPLWRLHRGRLFWPIMAFTAFVVAGLIRGKAAGSDTRIAIYEARTLFYIALLYVLVTNLFWSRRQYQRLLLLSLTAIGVQSIFALDYFGNLSAEERELSEQLGEHASAVHMGTLLVFLLALGLLRGSRGSRWWMLLFFIPALIAFFLSERRAAMVGLFIGVAVVTYFTYHRRRRAFWFFAPTALILGAGFVAGTWGADGAIGLPAQAVQSVIAPDALGAQEQSSNMYREVEALNLNLTIRDNAIAGVGFGRTFTVYYPMPDISFYEFWAYKPHNSILWIWLKMGFLGFVSMWFMVGRAIQHGARAALQVVPRRQALYVVVAVAFVVMLLVYSYVDIGWDPRSTVMLGFCFALCADFADARDPRVARIERAPSGAHLVMPTR